jgi:hypothetical protein
MIARRGLRRIKGGRERCRHHLAERSSEGGAAANSGLPNDEALPEFLEARGRSEAVG